MPWLAVTLIAGADSVDPLADALLERGAVSVDFADALAGTPGEHAIYAEPGENPADAWKLARVCALLTADADVAAVVRTALAATGLDPETQYAVECVEEQDWVQRTQSQFSPMHVSRRIWVVPTWCTPPDPGAINLVIDPGLAFGTGSHATTALCIAWLDVHLKGGETVIDYGCGSGILAIAALKLGALSAVGVDIDPQALLAAHRNAMQNQVTARFLSAEGAILEPADIVIANILANPLKVLAPLLARATRPGGRVALSGVLAHQAEETATIYREWYDMRIDADADGWVLLEGVRR